jgi:hypothetical protein
MWQSPQLGRTPALLLRCADCSKWGSLPTKVMLWQEVQNASVAVARLNSTLTNMPPAPTRTPMAKISSNQAMRRIVSSGWRKTRAPSPQPNLEQVRGCT